MKHLCLCLLGFALLSSCSPSVDTQVNALMSNAPAGYLRAQEQRRFTFPQDHSVHRGYRNEWWYLTGHLRDAQGAQYGLQLTLFRVALAPGPQGAAVWMTHLALSDRRAQKHHAMQWFNREQEGFSVVVAEHGAPQIQTEIAQLHFDQHGLQHIRAEAQNFSLDLAIRPSQAPRLQGDRGLSQKGQQPGNASYYYSQARLEARGTLRTAGTTPVSGQLWLDREWSSSALESDQIGWDWFALQLDDQRNIMVYQLRGKNAAHSPHSHFSIWGTDKAEHGPLPPGALQPQHWWQAEDGRRFPIAWRLNLPGLSPMNIDAWFAEQRMDLAVDYWEGAVDVTDQTGGLIGNGYLELTGY